MSLIQDFETSFGYSIATGQNVIPSNTFSYLCNPVVGVHFTHSLCLANTMYAIKKKRCYLTFSQNSAFAVMIVCCVFWWLPGMVQLFTLIEKATVWSLCSHHVIFLYFSFFWLQMWILLDNLFSRCAHAKPFSGICVNSGPYFPLVWFTVAGQNNAIQYFIIYSYMDLIN